VIQLDLFAWGAPPPPPPWRGQPRYGWRVWHPCACGRTHSGVYLDYPWSMLSLRHWRVSARSDATEAMMAERHAADNTPAAAQWGAHAQENAA